MGTGMVADKVAGMVIGMAADKKKVVLVLHVFAHGGREGGRHGRRHGGLHACMLLHMVVDKVAGMMADMAPALFTYFAGINFPLSLTTSGGVWNTSKRCRSSLR